ncbi:MAG TPA: DNA gyrase subunit A [Candidatus Nanoarchaeia archaeon]|nr:DNA gyrase subunit A [Candidatus Nanoarchaeia archaeon]
MTPANIDEEKIEKEMEEKEQERRKKGEIEKGVAQAEIVEEMEQAFIDYAMSVIVDRALPAVEDGLKPVHRRILWAMNSLGLDASKATRKSATVVGEVIGKYHPHGDTAVYDSMVRLAQDFSLRYPLVHGQGNFGSMDGDSPAAMRYTEAKLSKIAEELLQDIEKNSVVMRPNFDNSEQEPETLPAKLPNLLLNGATGIAVGMATNIPPHNLTNVCDTISAYINKPTITDAELAEIIEGPDFPTGGIITGPGIKDVYTTGKGKIIIRAKTSIEDHKDRSHIIVTEIPYMVNKADLVKSIAELHNEKKLPDISDLRDESAKGKVRIVIELKKNVDPKYTLNKLYKMTNLQTSFDANMLALSGKQPRILTIKQIIEAYVNYRKLTIKNRSKFDLKKAEDRIEIVQGLLLALKQIDGIVAFIKKASNATEAHDGLMKKFGLSSRQAKAVLETRLQQLTHLEDNKLKDEEKELKELIADLKKLLSNDHEVLLLIKKDVSDLKRNYGDERRTKIIKKIDEITEQDMIEKKDVVVMLTEAGYIKRVDLKTYKEQKRGGAGISGTDLKEEDFVRKMLTCNTHDYLLFFTNRGRVYWLKANDVPASERQSKGKAIVNVLSLREETITNVMSVRNFDSGYLFFVTKLGIVKKLPLKDVSKPRNVGVRIMNLPADGSDSVVNVRIVSDNQEVMIVTKHGQAVRFTADEESVRSMGRASYGVKGVELSKNDEVVALETLPSDGKGTVLVIGDKGYGKRSELEEFRKTARATKGVIAMETSDKTGDIVSALNVDNKDSVMITTTKGMVIRIGMKDIRVMGRATQGVRVVNLKDGDKVADVVKVPNEEAIVEAKEGTVVEAGN